MRQQTFVNNKSTLYIVATPIGNMSEFTPRAIEVLKSVSLIACEDTRTSKILLNRFDINTPLASYHKFNEKESVEKFLSVLEQGKDIALISDAGYPLVSDPGSVLVEKVLEHGYNVTSVSGASAFLNALVSSGFSLSKFTFIGFLDSKKTARRKELMELKKNKETLIFYESPHRVEETLVDMLEILGDRRTVLARELTKKFEEYIRGTISEILKDTSNLKGEMVIVVEGDNSFEEVISDEIIIEKIKELLKEGKKSKDILDVVCNKYDLKKNYVYDLLCEVKEK